MAKPSEAGLDCCNAFVQPHFIKGGLGLWGDGATDTSGDITFSVLQESSNSGNNDPFDWTQVGAAARPAFQASF